MIFLIESILKLLYHNFNFLTVISGCLHIQTFMLRIIKPACIPVYICNR